MSGALLSAARAQAMDNEAAAQWGLNPFALVEAAGRACAEAFVQLFRAEAQRREVHKVEEMPSRGNCKVIPKPHNKLRVLCASVSLCEVFGKTFVVLAGKGNNAADALMMLKALILNGYAQPSACSVIAAAVSEPSAANGDATPLSEALLAVQKIGVPALAWSAEAAAALANADVIIDGIAGTGISGPLRGAALEMAEALNALNGTATKPFIVAIDVPSGNGDGWRPGMPIVAADLTLAIEPQKLCLYTPAARQYAGTIIPVGGIFPPILSGRYREAELVVWESAAANIAPLAPTAYKYERGVVEIRAGSPGAAGAAKLAAMGAQAAGAGLVRLIVDPSLYPVVAPGCCGIMVDTESGRFTPTAILLGPGWGRGEDRMRLLEQYLPLEEQGIPLILDADAIALAQDMVFHGNALLTPHPGEFAAYTGLSKDEILSDPIPVLRRCAAEKQAYILFKSHVLYAAAPDGRIGIIDGMNPALAAGGCGDVLAGFCAAIAARQKPFDGYACACAAASLLIQAAESEDIAATFFDPAELPRAAAGIAGKAWLSNAFSTIPHAKARRREE